MACVIEFVLQRIQIKKNIYFFFFSVFFFFFFGVCVGGGGGGGGLRGRLSKRILFYNESKSKIKKKTFFGGGGGGASWSTCIFFTMNPNLNFFFLWVCVLGRRVGGGGERGGARLIKVFVQRIQI